MNLDSNQIISLLSFPVIYTHIHIPYTVQSYGLLYYLFIRMYYYVSVEFLRKFNNHKNKSAGTQKRKKNK